MSDPIADLLKNARFPSQSRSDGADETPESHDGARNGLSFADIARSGMRIFSACMKEVALPEEGTWIFAAREATRQIENAYKEETDLPVKPISAYIAGWADPGVPFESRTDRERLSFEAVTRHWVNLIASKVAQDVASLESSGLKTWPAWVEARLPKPAETNGHTNGKTHPHVNGSEPVVREVATQTPTQKAAPRVADAMSKMIDLRIAEMEQEIGSLRAFKAKLGPGDDAALWKLFGPVLSKEPL